MSAPRVLIVEDEEALITLLTYNLEAEGFVVSSAMDGEEGLAMAEDVQPDLILLDWMMPGLSGIEVCRALRAHKTLCGVPIIMLTARGEESDRVRGLETGADDYLVKPFSPRELIARVNAVLRRVRPSSTAEELKFEDIVLDRTARRVFRDGTEIHLGPTEFRLLDHLMANPGRVYPREQLLDIVWGRDVYVELRTVDVHIRRLRKAINIHGLPDLIRTVRAAGYALDHPQP